ncbi:MAG: 50S ribosomal protein L16 [Fusobacterium sp.]|uniref:50S ribosomal protein L16 n=1 Tax=Fusobacterium TaxID=848 RepID=UPI0015A07C7F|nr:50S ribosomal protein L16 [Fusobacterium perfoetens]MBS5037559.1 50S ribosomal protein L16 [Fusobacterium sp.]MCF2626154.1 50S ribosomal protein L16 [Fusobacterium perfoetens]
MLMPKRTKHRKMFRGRMKGSAQRGNTVAFGDYGLQALEPAWITNRQIESCRIGINRTFKREGKTFIRIFPDKPITSRPAGVRMGKGKGAVEGWVCVVKPGRIMFEVSQVSEELAMAALRKASMKLPIRCKIVKRENGGDK